MQFTIQSNHIKFYPTNYDKEIAVNLMKKNLFFRVSCVAIQHKISNSESMIAKYNIKIKKYNRSLQKYSYFKKSLKTTKRVRQPRLHQILKTNTLYAKIIKAKNYISPTKATNIRLQSLYSKNNSYLKNKILQEGCQLLNSLEERKQQLSQLKQDEIAKIQVLNNELQNIKEQHNHITQHINEYKEIFTL